MTATSPAPAGATPLLEARNVSKYFGAVVALEDVSLAVRAGQINCLLGDNGAGKSTLIKMLSGVHTPDSGTLAVDGQPIQFSAPRDALDAGIATVYQDLSVLPQRSPANRRRIQLFRTTAVSSRAPIAILYQSALIEA